MPLPPVPVHDMFEPFSILFFRFYIKTKLTSDLHFTERVLDDVALLSRSVRLACFALQILAQHLGQGEDIEDVLPGDDADLLQLTTHREHCLSATTPVLSYGSPVVVLRICRVGVHTTFI